MLAVIDAGNTNTVLGVFDGEYLRGQWRATTDIRRTADEWIMVVQAFLARDGLNFGDLDAVVIGSVVPPVTAALTAACEIVHVPTLVVSGQTDAGMPVLLDEPSELGADRMANAVAAFAEYGGPVIVVDMGTATAFDIVSANGEFVGGIILPGVNISLEALFAKASALKRVPLSPTTSVIGRNTVDAVRSGATHGFAAQVDGLCERIERELGPCHIVATGGFSSVIAPLAQQIQLHDPSLTLRGLRLIHERLGTPEASQKDSE